MPHRAPARQHATAIVFGLLVLLPSPALAWGEAGHRTVQAIAYARLDPAAKAEIDRLMATENTNFPEVGFWADAVARKQEEYRFAQPLHFCNVQKGAAGYDAKRDRPEQGDVVGAIERYAAVLKDKNKPDAERLEALKF